MKVLFVYPNATLQNPPPVSLAIFYALLKDINNVEIKIFDTTLYSQDENNSDKIKEKNLQVRPFDFSDRGIRLINNNVFDDFKKMVDDYQPDLIALSANEVTISLGIDLLKVVNKNNTFILVGGVFATFAPKVLLAYDFIDAVCVGEGEKVLLELVERIAQQKDLTNIENLWIKKDGTIVKNKLRPLVDLNKLPLPNYDIFDEARFYRPMAGKVWRLFPIETSRGCPYGCTYCNSPSQKQQYIKSGHTNFFRKKSIDTINREIKYLIEKYNAEYIYFLSDTLLCLNDREFNEFCEMYSQYKLPFWCQNRPEMVTLERMTRLKDIGCYRMSIGLEHGNEEFRRKILNKKVSNEVIVKAFDILDQVGIPVSVNNIIGFPGENRDLAFDTIRLNRQIKFDTSNAYAFTPFRGTPLYEECVEKGYIAPDKSLHIITKGSSLDMPGFTKSEIDGLIKTFALYARMPEEYFPLIKLAEDDSPVGEQMFKELSDIYSKLYFSESD